MHILVADDDPAVRESLRRSLAFNGYDVVTASDGEEALRLIAADRPDAVVLDLMMPRMDGLQACRTLRSQGDDLPVLMLTARDGVADRVAGLDAGADDYLPKPFALEELLARLRALLRRTRTSGVDPADEILTFADLSLDPVTREVTRAGRPLRLTRTEFSLLDLFLSRPRRVLTRALILQEVWGFDFPTTANSLEVYVGYLRRKTEEEGEGRLIHTVRGVGYVLRETPPVSLRTRLALLVALAVAFGVALVAVAAYVTVGTQLRAQLDAGLIGRAEAAVNSPLANPELLVKVPAAALGAGDVEIAIVASDGQPYYAEGSGSQPPLGQQELAVARGLQAQSLRTGVDSAGDEVRVAAVPVPQCRNGCALVLAQSTEQLHRTLDRLALVLLLVGLVGVGLAALAGLAVASAGLRPVERLTRAAEHVSRTGIPEPLDIPEGPPQDELARLATTFNAMLAALAQSRDQQRRLVADAGHELRTPLTSLRTNLDLLAQSDAAGAQGGRTLDAADRAALLSDVRAQVEELGDLVGDVVELAREDTPESVAEQLDLSEVVERAVARVRRRAPRVTFTVDADPWPMVGDDALLERAVTNLLDNAARWSPADSTVAVALHAGRLTVADQGPGIADGDLPHVFERFYRSPDARATPGSGLGLAIVRQAAERHGGAVAAGRTTAGGALLTFVVPGAAPVDPAPSAAQVVGQQS